MSRIALLEPPYADQAGALLARMMPGDVPPIGLFRMFARNLPMAGAMHGWGRYAVAGLSVRILDTRKTAPGLRALDKYAVATAGASNHRLDLAAMVLLKENHIAVAGGVGAAVAAIRAHNAAGIAVEVEVESVAQAAEALRTGVEWIMLDNMPIEDMRYIVTLRGSEGPPLEASGSITLDTVRAVAETGVDAISVGAITHSAPAFDLSLLLTPTAPAGGGHPARFG